MRSAAVPSGAIGRPRWMATASSDGPSMSSRTAGTTPAATTAPTARAASSTRPVGRRQRPSMRRQRHQPHGDFGQDGQRALRSDQQIGQGVAGDVLHRLRTGAHDLAGRQHRLEGQHVAAGRPVLEGARSAGALGDVAADGAFRQAGRIGRIEQAVRLDRVVQIAGDHVGLDDREQVLGVDLEDAVEAGHRQHDAAAHRHRSAGVAGAGATHDQRRAGLVAQPGDGGDLGDRSGRDHDVGRVAAAAGHRAPCACRVAASMATQASPAMRGEPGGEAGSHVRRPAAAATALARVHEFLEPRDPLAQPVERGRVGDADEAGRVEALAGGQGDAGLGQQRLGELRRGGRRRTAPAARRRRGTGRTPRRASGTRSAGRRSARPASDRGARWYSSRIAATASCGPVSAATVAFWAIDETFEVEWPCTVLQAVTNGAGAIAQPQRQPVIA